MIDRPDEPATRPQSQRISAWLVSILSAMAISVAVPFAPQQAIPPTPGAARAPSAAQAPPVVPHTVPAINRHPPAIAAAPAGQVFDVPRPRPLAVPVPRPASPVVPQAVQPGSSTPSLAAAPSVPTAAAPASGPVSAHATGPGAAPRPVPASGTVTISPQASGTSVGPALVTAQSGRQPPHAVPSFDVKETGDRWHCVASGHRVRKAFDEAGNEFYAGALPGIGVSAVAMVRDVPAWHDLSTDCLIAVGEHPKARAARR